MEYVNGPSLFSYLERKGRQEKWEAINITMQRRSALCAIHEVGLFHGDLKPENIHLAKGGLVKLMDFGLAKDERMRLTAPGRERAASSGRVRF